MLLSREDRENVDRSQHSVSQPTSPTKARDRERTSPDSSLEEAGFEPSVPRLASSRWLIALIAEAEKLWPHSSSVIAFTLRVETPCTYISASAATSARSER